MDNTLERFYKNYQQSGGKKLTRKEFAKLRSYYRNNVVRAWMDLRPHQAGMLSLPLVTCAWEGKGVLRLSYQDEPVRRFRTDFKEYLSEDIPPVTNDDTLWLPPVLSEWAKSGANPAMLPPVPKDGNTALRNVAREALKDVLKDARRGSKRRSKSMKF
jgi:hypothetical protein